MLNKQTRQKIIAYIDATTDYDASTVRFHRDGTVSAIKDANKTCNGPETIRLLVGIADCLVKRMQEKNGATQ